MTARTARTALTLLLSACVMPGLAWAYSPDMYIEAPDCFDDPGLCADDTICFDARCVDPALICETSETCAADHHCDLTGGRAEQPGLCVRTAASECAADTDCGADEICVGQPGDERRSPTCAPDDARCTAAWGFECRFDARFCPEGDAASCRDGERCVASRCTAEVLVERAEALVVDPDREAAVRAGRGCGDAAILESGGSCVGADDNDTGGCAIGGGGPAPVVLMIGALLFAVGRRRA